MTTTTRRPLRTLQLTAASLALVAWATSFQVAAQTAAQTADRSAAPASGREAMAAGLIVKFRDGQRSDVAARATMQGLRAHAQGRGLALAVAAVRETGTGARVIHLQRPMPARDLEAIAQELKLYDPAIEFVEPNYIAESHFVPNDTRFGDQWALSSGAGGISVAKAWDVNQGTGMRVAVLDTGVRLHADLTGNLVPGSSAL